MLGEGVAQLCFGGFPHATQQGHVHCGTVVVGYTHTQAQTHERVQQRSYDRVKTNTHLKRMNN